jgi:hypothetical protein
MGVWLSPLLHWLARERNWYELADRLAGVLRIMSGALFLGSSDSVQSCRWLVECCHIRGPPVGSVRWVYVDWRGKRMCRVGWVSPAGCTSIRIAATLGYE